MRSKLFLFAAALGGLLLAGCSDELTVKGNDESKETGTVAFEVRSVFGGEWLDSVVVRDLLSGKKISTKEGRAVFSGLPVGERRFTFEKEGYATLMFRTEVALDTLSPDLPVARDQDVVVELPRLGAKVVGRVYAQEAEQYDKDAVLGPAKNASVHLRVWTTTGWLMPYEYEARTDSAGWYEFDDLPEFGDSTEIYISTADNPVYDGKRRYPASLSEYPNILPGETYRVADLYAYRETATRVAPISTNFADGVVRADMPFEILFSEPVDTAAHWLNRFEVYDSYLSNRIAVAVSWSDGGRKLSIRSATGKWTEGKIYELELRAYTAEGVEMEFNADVYVAYSAEIAAAKGLEMLGAVDAMAADSWDDAAKCLKPSTSTIYLAWNKPKNAETIFHPAYRVDGLEDFVLFDEIQGDTAVAVNAATLPNLAARQSVTFAVQACNELECVPASAGKPLKLKICEP